MTLNVVTADDDGVILINQDIDRYLGRRDDGVPERVYTIFECYKSSPARSVP